MSNKISRIDITDSEFVDAVELVSDGYTVYRTGSLTSTSSSSKAVLINSANDLDILDNVDEPVQVLDRIYITGSTAADGYYTINSIISNVSFSVLEDILDSTGGTIFYIHPSGASKVGVDTTLLGNSSANNLQDVISDLDQSISDGYNGTPAASQVGQVLYSIDGETFQKALPVTSCGGWLINNCGIHIVNIPPEDE